MVQLIRLPLLPRLLPQSDFIPGDSEPTQRGDRASGLELISLSSSFILERKKNQSELELELIQTQMAQKPVLRMEGGARCVAQVKYCEVVIPI